MPTVINTLVEGSLTNIQQVELEWQPLTTYAERGGAVITSYNIQWDAGLYGLSWTHLVGFDSDLKDTEYILT